MRKIAIIISLIISTVSFAQNQIGLGAAKVKGEVRLRWTPSSYDLWQEGSAVGYYIYRAELNQTGGNWVPSNPIKLTEEPLKPLSQNELLDRVKEDSSYLKVLGAIGKTDENSNETITSDDNFTEAIQGQQWSFLIGMMLANFDYDVATKAGLGWTDKNIVEGKKYVYQVVLARESREQIYGKTLIDLSKEIIIEAPNSIDGYATEKRVSLMWDGKRMGYSYAYYDIYRSTSSKKGFEKVNALPFISLSTEALVDKDAILYNDSVPALDTKYYYKVKGVTVFGQESPFSKVVEVNSGRRLQGHPQIIAHEFTEDFEVELELEVPEIDYDIIDYLSIERAKDPLKGYTKISEKSISKKTKKWLDEEPLQGNYYRVCSHGLQGDKICSPGYTVLIPDSIPPVPPVGLQGTVDTNGVVTLLWSPNPEEDVIGYRVFRANIVEEEFYRITPSHIPDTTLMDTVSLKINYDEIHYRVVAIDGYFNPSEFSEILTLKRPDKIRPIAPVLKGYTSTPTGIEIEWARSSSNDVVSHTLYHRDASQRRWEQIYSTSNDTVRTYVDTATVKHHTYEYMILAIDDAGLVSDTTPTFFVKQMIEPVKPSVQNLEAIVSQANKMVKLKWAYSYSGVKKYTIYRKSLEGSLKYQGSVPGTTKEFYDKRMLKAGEHYEYKIMALFYDGTKSMISDGLLVKYE